MHSTIIAGLTLLAVCAVSLTAVGSSEAKESAPTGVLSYTVKDIDGHDVSLSKYQGKVLLIVNTASFCGNTPQYAKLEKLYDTYKDQGLCILGFPANNFGSQEPGDNATIKTFCTSKYNVSFDMFSKISVKGDDKAPLYQYLTDKTTDPKYGGDIEWNFAKFLVNRKGEVVNRFPAGHDPSSADVTTAIEAALKDK